MSKIATSFSLLTEIEGVDLYAKLIEQLNKDFNLVGVEKCIHSDCSPQDLILQLQRITMQLINTNFDGYLNLLYRVDVSENEIKKLDGSDLEKMTEQVVYLLLKREWQKVWFKNNF